MQHYVRAGIPISTTQSDVSRGIRRTDRQIELEDRRWFSVDHIQHNALGLDWCPSQTLAVRREADQSSENQAGLDTHDTHLILQREVAVDKNTRHVASPSMGRKQ